MRNTQVIKGLLVAFASDGRVNEITLKQSAFQGERLIRLCTTLAATFSLKFVEGFENFDFSSSTSLVDLTLEDSDHAFVDFSDICKDCQNPAMRCRCEGRRTAERKGGSAGGGGGSGGGGEGESAATKTPSSVGFGTKEDRGLGSGGEIIVVDAGCDGELKAITER